MLTPGVGLCRCRAGASDLPQVAALLGGIVAQEAIKLITRQYTPLNGTCIYDGIHSTTKVSHLPDPTLNCFLLHC